MKIIKPPLININLNKFLILLCLYVIILTGCKNSYEKISLGDYSGNTAGISEFSPEKYGYIIYDIDSKKIIKGHNIHKEFTPASVTKLFTALFAVETLGYDYTFSTTLSYNGKISDNILTGDLYLKGTGDPELSIPELLSMVNILKEKITEVKGNFYFDETVFPPRDMLEKDMPSDASYNAGISPLTFNSNIIYALQRKTSDGKITSADMLPSIPAFSSYIYTENLPYPFLKFSYKDSREIWGLPNKYLWDSRQQLPVKHPGLFTAQTFQKLCGIHGIKLPSPKSGAAPSNSDTISCIKSKLLPSIIKNMLFTSNNLTAELLYTITSAEYSDKNKTNAMENFFSGFTAFDWKNFKILNASGLTDLNRATLEQTAAVLLFIEKMNNENFTLEEILPLSGWDGTMKARLDQPGTAFRVYGKTGSIFYASGLAGMFYANSGKKYIFTVYINDNNKRSEYNSKTNKTADDLNQGGLWTKKASSAIDNFLIRMIEEL